MRRKKKGAPAKTKKVKKKVSLSWNGGQDLASAEGYKGKENRLHRRKIGKKGGMHFSYRDGGIDVSAGK